MWDTLVIAILMYAVFGVGIFIGYRAGHGEGADDMCAKHGGVMLKHECIRRDSLKPVTP